MKLNETNFDEPSNEGVTGYCQMKSMWIQSNKNTASLKPIRNLSHDGWISYNENTKASIIFS